MTEIRVSRALPHDARRSIRVSVRPLVWYTVCTLRWPCARSRCHDVDAALIDEPRLRPWRSLFIPILSATFSMRLQQSTHTHEDHSMPVWRRTANTSTGSISEIRKWLFNGRLFVNDKRVSQLLACFVFLEWNYVDRIITTTVCLHSSPTDRCHYYGMCSSLPEAHRLMYRPFTPPPLND